HNKRDGPTRLPPNAGPAAGRTHPMTSRRLLSLLTLALLGLAGTASASPVNPRGPGRKADDKLPMCGLTPSKLLPGLCVGKYRITSGSPQCQAFFDQGLGYYYSYVWMEAARSFETAARHDPDCPMAWWALSRALERYGKGSHNQALKKAQDLLPRASHRE